MTYAMRENQRTPEERRTETDDQRATDRSKEKAVREHLLPVGDRPGLRQAAEVAPELHERTQDYEEARRDDE